MVKKKIKRRRLEPRIRPWWIDDGRSALARAVAMFGSEKKLAIACGWSQQVLNRAVKRGRVSPELAKAIQRATGGAVTANELRPDLWRRAEDVPVESQFVSR